MDKSSKLYVGMDVHKESIDVATGDEGGGEVRHWGKVGGDLESVKRLVRKMESSAKELVFIYEAGARADSGSIGSFADVGTRAGWSHRV